MTQKYKQMSLLEDSLVKPSVKQDYKKAEQMIDGSGMKCLMLLSKSNRDGENVHGIINIEEGMVLRQVQNDLDSEGFKVQCFIIPASGIGAWHNRNRVWILACNISNTNSIRHRRGNSTRCADEEWTFLPREQEGGKMGSKTERRSNVSDTCIKRPQGYRLSTNVEEKQRREDLSTKTSAEEQQTWWQTQSKICGVPNGVSYGVDRDRAKRIKALGNSICPQIARQIGLAIMEAENDN